MEVSYAIFLAKRKLALEVRAVGPHFLAVPVLARFEPLAGVHGALLVHVGALAVCHAMKPVSVVKVAAWVDAAAAAIGLILKPVAFVLGAVSHYLDASAIALAAPGPLALINRSRI